MRTFVTEVDRIFSMGFEKLAVAQKMTPIIFIGLLSLLSGCASIATPEQRLKVVDAAKAINADFEKKQKDLPPSTLERKPVRTGQWVSFLMENRDRTQDLTLRTIRVIEASKEKTWVEVETQRASDKGKVELEAYWMENFPLEPRFDTTYRQFQTKVQRILFKKMVQKSGDKDPEPWPDEFLMFSKPWLEKLFIVGFSLEEKGAKPELCITESFRSDRCYVERFALKFLDHDSAGRAFMHSEVPIIGFLQASDDDYVYKTVAFGESGAAAKLAIQ